MAKRILPDRIFGENVEGAMERALNKKAGEEKHPNNPSGEAPQKEGFIYVPEIQLYVAKEKTLHNRKYEVYKELHSQGSKMPSIPEYIAFLNYLRGDYQKVNKQEADAILDEILTKRDPWRAEWLDARFENGKIIYHKFVNGKIQESAEELDKETSMQDKTPGISLEKLLRNPTSQGLPRKNISQGELYYWYPREGKVAGFDACSGGSDLGCDGGPDDSDPSLGVRLVVHPKGAS